MFKSFLFCCAVAITTLAVDAQVNITTRQVDLAHTCLNPNETILNPASVGTPGNFGLLFTQKLDGQCYTEPLYVSGLTLADGSVHNVVYVATEGDGVYAFDADNASGTNSQPLWYRSLLAKNCTPIPSGDTNCSNISPQYGITATPVIDLSSNTLYVVTSVKNTSNSTHAQYIYGLDIRTGATTIGPVLITATFPIPGGTWTFDPVRENPRAALVLYNGVVYVCYGAHCDVPTYYGLILGFDASTLALVKQFNASPNSSQVGIWQAGTGPAIDSSGNMFVSTGNGDFDSGPDWGESFLKLPTSGTFNVNDSVSNPLANWFTPSVYQTLTDDDLDLGSSGVLLLPDQTQGSHTHLLISGGKGGVLYVVDRDYMGGLESSTTNGVPVQEFQVGSEIYSTPAYFDGYIYYTPGSGPLTQQAVTYNPVTGAYLSASTNKSSNGYDTQGEQVFISANNAANDPNKGGLCWIENSNSPGTLDVYNAANVSGKPIYSFTTILPNTGQSAGTNLNCTIPHFNLCTVANGKAFLTAYDSNNAGHLFVLGLLAQATTLPAPPSNLVATAVSSSQVTLNWTDNSNNESGFKVFRAAQAAGPFAQVGFTNANISTFTDSNLSSQVTYYYEVSATNNIGDSTPSNISSATTLLGFNPTGLVAYWNFDEGSGYAAYDSSGNGHTGTLNGEVAWVPGFINTALNFHGVGNATSNVEIPNSSSLQFTATQSFTLSAWVYQGGTNSTADEAVIAKSRDQGNYYGIWINAANHWVFRGPPPGGDIVGPAANLATWTHVAAVQDGTAGTRTLYINYIPGSAVTSGRAQAADGAGDFWIGQANGVTQPFPGEIDEVRLYNRALAASEIPDLKGPPVLQAASSLTHGSAGTFSLFFPTNGTVAIEPREGSPQQGTYNLVLTFSSPVSGITASLGLQSGQTGSAVGTAGAASYDATGKVVTIPLTGVGNQQCLNLHLIGINPGNGAADIPFNILWGKVSGSGAVNIGDALTVRSQASTTLNNSNCIYDVNVDGQINIGDALSTRSLAGTSLP